MMEKKKSFELKTTHIIALGFVILIFVGSILLSLPFAAADGQRTPYIDALFTATTSSCVTGLVTVVTGEHWSFFGQVVILIMIQLGGLGVVSFTTLLLIIAGKRIQLKQRMLIQEAYGFDTLTGLVRMVKKMIKGSLIVEGIGAVLYTFIFIPRYGLLKGIWVSVFTSISAFCNAGMDLMGANSMMDYVDHPLMNLITMGLIVIGGLGFFVWRDLVVTRFHFKKCKLHTKIVLTTSIILIIAGAVIIFLMEFGETGTQGKSIPEQLLNAMFQSVTARTAGFNTVDLSKLTEGSIFMMIMLMLVGGSPGSTAGGMKTTTIAVLTISIISIFRRKKSEEAFGRRMEEGVMRTAACVFMIYLLLINFSAMLISKLENVTMMTALFETTSALGTVGLTLGITPQLGMFSKMLLAVLMFVGRVGSLTILMAFSSPKKMVASKLPLEKVQIG